MLALLNKEISAFFSSLTGYLVLCVFLLTTGLFLWVIPGDLNVLYGGYASLEPLFILAPWVFLFLIPAITMRLFAEERKSGTLELLLTRPVSPMGIVWSKFVAGWLLAAFSILPTLLYIWVVYALGAEQGNLDTGATWGSYLGLLMLASIYVSIGLFASVVTDNQIVAFVLAVAMCFVCFSGFDSLALLPSWRSVQGVIAGLGIQAHYDSISRGVLDLRDVVYFFSVSFFFVYLTRWVLQLKK